MSHASRHRCSPADLAFRRRFEACEVPPAEFGHREHVRLAYLYLAEAGVEAAHRRVRRALQAFIRHNGVDPAKYHETITRAWVLAVAHFMAEAAPAQSAEAFIAATPRLLDPAIMLTHYSRAQLFSDEARAGFVEPDLAPIPRHD